LPEPVSSAKGWANVGLLILKVSVPLPALIVSAEMSVSPYWT
jgi:hypothetical protein